MFHRSVLVSILALPLCSTPARAAAFGDVRGIVHDPDHRPIPQANVRIHAVNSDWQAAAQTGAEGAFEFRTVPVGRYTIEVRTPGFAVASETVVVHSGSAPILHFPLKVAPISTTVETSERAELVDPQSASNSTLVDRRAIEQMPGADRTNSLAMITNSVPGAYVTHDQLHIRGGHQVTWTVDGVPVPNTNIASNVGPQFDPKDIDYLEVQRGGYSAEYGDRTYCVFNVVARTGFERQSEGELVASYGSFHQTNDQVNFGSHTSRFAYYASISGNRTDLGLATPGPDVLHDRGSGMGGFGTLVYNANAANQLRFVGSLRGDDYQIPNDPDLEAAGVRDRERERDAFANLTWIHDAGNGVLLTVSPFYHFNRAHYLGVVSDVAPGAEDNQVSNYAGAQMTAGLVKGRHNAKVGVYGFAQGDTTLFGITDPSAVLRLQQRLTGHLEAAFLEEQFRAFSWLTLTGGLRLTHFSGALSENAASPRVGAAIRLPRLNWVLHGFYGRYYQAPPLSTVTGPLLAFAGDQGIGFLPLRGERDEEHQFGLSIPVRGWTLEADHFLTRARNYFDHSVLGNSNVFFPVTIDGARIRGWEVLLRSPRLLRRGQVHLAYSNQRAEGQGTVSGGLTDFSPPPDGRFLLDHDQAHTLNVGFVLDLPSHAWASGNVYYGSGFPDDEGPARLPGHTTVDLMLAKQFGESATISVNALNLANRRYLVDNSLTFGGTHFADPRQVFVQLKYRFHL